MPVTIKDSRKKKKKKSPANENANQSIRHLHPTGGPFTPPFPNLKKPHEGLVFSLRLACHTAAFYDFLKYVLVSSILQKISPHVQFPSHTIVAGFKSCSLVIVLLLEGATRGRGKQ